MERDMQLQSQNEFERYDEPLRFLNESMDDYLFLVDLRSGNIRFFSDIHKKYNLPAPREEGYTLEEWFATVCFQDLPPLQTDLTRVMNGKKNHHDMYYRLLSRDGSYVWINCRGKCRKDSQGRPLLMLGRVTEAVGEQDTDRRNDAAGENVQAQARADAARHMEFYRAMLTETIAYSEFDMDELRILASGGLWSAYERESARTGKSFIELLERNLVDVVLPKDIELCRSYLQVGKITRMYEAGRLTEKTQFKRWIDGQLRWVELVVHAFREPQEGHLYALYYLKDIDVEKRREMDRERAARRDPLTNVYNRRSFEDKLNRYMEEDAAESGALILLDLDDFKAINDRYGHQEGDAAILRVTGSLAHVFGEDALVGRLGGDEFIAFIKKTGSREALDSRIEQVLSEISREPNRVFVTCSAGITFVDPLRYDYSRSLQEADKALYRSKWEGKNKYCYYNERGDLQQ